MSFISWLPLTLTATLNGYFYWHLASMIIRIFWGLPSRRTCVRVSPLTKSFCACCFVFVRLFFANFFNVSKGCPRSIFFYFATEWMFKKFQRVTLYIFRHYATYHRLQKTFEKNWKCFFPDSGTVEENTWHFEVLLLVLSRRYGADLGRSRLVIPCRYTSKNVPGWNVCLRNEIKIGLQNQWLSGASLRFC